MRHVLTTLSAALALASAAVAQVHTPTPADTPVSQMERLDRGLIVVARPGATTGLASWRLLGTDDTYTTFRLLKDGQPYANGREFTRQTSVSVTGINAATTFQVVTLYKGEPVDTSAAVTPWTAGYLRIQLDRPAAGTDYEYTPNDCSVGDVDGDGQYELIVKWDPTNSKDNSQGGITGNVYLDCYRFDGTKLWRIDLGPNIRAGAHYTQFMVYDFDGDGCAEMMCKTAPGSIDGAGRYVNQAATLATIRSANNTTVFRNGDGRIVGGQEYLTVFSGLTGEALHTIFYNPNRDQEYGGAASGSFNWGKPDGKNDAAAYGNRGERYLAAVAYLGGPDASPSAIFTRGYYGYAFAWAVDFDGKQLTQRWLHASKSKTEYCVTTFNGSDKGTTQTYTPGACTSGEGRNTLFANGNHNLSVGDVDGDGRDELIWGSAALDDDGKLLYAVGFGHGDAIHLADLDPTRPGLEVFDIHEDKGTYAWDVHDAATGEILFKGGPEGVDNGRGLAAQLNAQHRGYYFWSAKDSGLRSAVSGNVAYSNKPSMNFRIYWNGDLQDELLDGINITHWTTSSITAYNTIGRASIASLGNPASCNSTKATPCLMADIFGDWREEVIFWSQADPSVLCLFSTVEVTSYRVPTLMHDHVYRMGIAWQNVAYNQPPHLGYYLPDFIKDFQGETYNAVEDIVADTADAPLFNLNGQAVSHPRRGIYLHRGRKVVVQ